MTDDASLGRIGRYELLSRLGTGGMGEVFLARFAGEAGFEKTVVIKRMLPHLAGNSTFVNRFLDEGRLVVQLRHAGIAQVLDLGSDDGVIFLAMEHVDGRDMRELMHLARIQDGVPTNVAVGMLVRVLEALEYAHSFVGAEGKPLDIIHRDVSPSNVMVSRAGEVKLVDFGIARAADRLGTSVSGAVQGKYGYMSPQQAAGGELDARSDQWSVGVMAWELLVGSRPFDGATDLETLDRIRQHDPGSLADAAPAVPDEVVAVIDRMLCKEPAERFADAGEAARALQAYLIHIETIVGARDIAGWFDQCLEALPPERREQPGAAFSLDDALRLNLGGDANREPMGTPGTISIADGMGATPSPGIRGIIPTPTRPPAPSDDRPLSITDVTSPAARGRWLAVLVVLNLALLFTVASLVAEITTESATRPETMSTSEARDDAPRPAIPAVSKSVSPPAAVVAPAAVKPPPEPAAPEPAKARAVVVEEPAAPKAAPNRKPKATNKRSETGTVRFRYFPASAIVKIDGQVVSTRGSNRVDTRLPVGRHRMVLTHGDQRRTRAFEVKTSQTTNLATITLAP